MITSRNIKNSSWSENLADSAVTSLAEIEIRHSEVASVLACGAICGTSEVPGVLGCRVFPGTEA